MYFRASRLEIPPWLIDMRHKISHDQDLPTLESLRTASEFALKWLQVKLAIFYIILKLKLLIKIIIIFLLHVFRQNIGIMMIILKLLQQNYTRVLLMNL